MDMTPAQRKAVFALIVLVLAGLGVYLVVSGVHGASPSSSHAPNAGSAASTPSAAPSASQAPAPAPAPSVPDIYQWLPFTQPELAAAASVVTEFSRDYGTWSYTQGSAAYVAAMGDLVTPELSQVLAQGYSVPGVASQRATQKQVSKATAVINSLRAFGPSSMTFVVTVSQQITGTDTGGGNQATTQYAVTVTGSGSAWQVNDIELAAAGNS
jgi:hypothetical protein